MDTHPISNRAQGSNSHLMTSFGNDGVPNPVTGSHPGLATNPGVPQPWFPPLVMSLKALANDGEYI